MLNNYPTECSLTPGSGILFIVSAPAGTGKTTLVQKVAERFPNVVESISFTTREKRAGEKEGQDYNFVSVDDFKKRIESGEFLEYATFLGNYYGTSKAYLEKQRQEGKHVILTIDTKGAMQLKERSDTVFVFLLPPSEKELRRRLEERKTESPEVIEGRLEKAKKELILANRYDYQIINDQIDVAAEALGAIVIAETHRTRRVLKGEKK